MKAIMIMFDSLNRHMLPNYGCDWTQTPNFQRLGKKSVTFDNFYAGSMPCMPARRELHTGRYNFLHRSWGPLEPFDISMPEMLKDSGIYTHLVSDHFHYWEDGGATYHNKYSTWDIIRGQQGDLWNPQVKEPDIPPCENPRQFNIDNWKQDWKNREIMIDEVSQPMPRCFDGGLKFINDNKDEDNWFLQIETFDPHEPFFTQEKYKDLYPHEYDGNHYDWINYGRTDEDNSRIKHLKYEYAALLSMCDEYLGKVLDIMDANNMFEDTMLIVNTDHGLMLGEKQWYGKNIQPFYQEIAHLPFFVYDPRNKIINERRDALCQTIDLAPTLLDFFGLDIPSSMQGQSIQPVIEDNEIIHESVLFGIHGGHVNVTDGRYVYMRANATYDNGPLYEYTLMPTHMREMFSKDELKTAELVKADTFTSIDVPVIRTKASSFIHSSTYGNLFFDLNHDYKQENPINDAKIELDMLRILRDGMQHSDAPIEQYERLGINPTGKKLLAKIKKSKVKKTIDINSTLSEILANPKGKVVLEKYFKSQMNNPMMKMAKGLTIKQIAGHSKGKLTDETIDKIAMELKDI